MEPITDTGVEYPRITLGGVEYTLKITRGALMYRFSKLGISMGQIHGTAGIALLADQMHALISDRYRGTPEDVLEMLLAEDKIKEASLAVGETIKKVFPPLTQTAPAADLKAGGQPPVQ